MADGEFKLFRTKNVEAIESPESLTDYLRVTSPRVWLLLGAIVVMMIGVIIWSIMGRIDTSIKVAVISNGNERVCYVPADAVESAVNRQCISVDGSVCALRLTEIEPEVVSEETDVVARLTGSLNYGDVVYRIPIVEALDAGNYMATLQTESLRPISLLFN